MEHVRTKDWTLNMSVQSNYACKKEDCFAKCVMHTERQAVHTTVGLQVCQVYVLQGHCIRQDKMGRIPTRFEKLDVSHHDLETVSPDDTETETEE